MIKIASSRFFSASSNLCASSTKAAKVLNKLMNGNKSKKKRYYEETNDQGPKLMPAKSLASSNRQGKESNRRIAVLNKLFMKNITDLMATGSFASDLYGYGIQISRVRVAPDFREASIYWFSTNLNKDVKIDGILKPLSSRLRHELSQLRLMGEVPQLTFVQDKRYYVEGLLNSLLKQADYGEDGTEEYEQEHSQTGSEEHRLLEPEMKHDILGLDHAQIMNRIRQSVDKTNKAWKMHQEIQKKRDEASVLQKASKDSNK
ncbi:putative ribosome-binding factor A, mitochondrial [Anopheles moucheti]|uniref:putative ribosome-binding factor A, mitochondrial n=1 Tax=Anopheles moucheti TaxID=186751 RepID=UPI0022F08786|nr:putative ribosome-binding factor A, mitochondrial [Anopheles moucheti]XP_052891968.1 putative ribosome-binding factor A, mitochondrial [Anopheles moucheti]XP_052891969.1 putative ribosome-binding factor A, mitochondrial [Anopheles moucheti]XP_052891970.1 putative ribosome-binding factor A, mitochondrial [Anopheles moucheti]XP_052891971.1 putative ribosome-binding factor A, mitochondrial [Anopheles moucheti]XP_052891972.1 putative ribosome-binding factor A, mitochondrial [Anopheles moucheti]